MMVIDHHFRRYIVATALFVVGSSFLLSAVDNNKNSSSSNNNNIGGQVVAFTPSPSLQPIHNPKSRTATATATASGSSATNGRNQHQQRYNQNIYTSSLLSFPSPVTPSRRSASSSDDEQDTTIMDNDDDDDENDKQSPSPSPDPQDTTNSNSLMEKITTAIGSTTSMAVAGTFYVVLCYRRDALMVSFFGGAISNGILSKVLKKVLNVARPVELDTATVAKQNGGVVPSDNGMPSSHAMSLGFICTFTAIHIPALALPLLAYTVISLRYRINTKLHSFDQILVGAILGSVNGAIFHALCYGTLTSLPLLGRINVMEWVSNNILSDGLLPWYLLSIPALVGAAVVGSIERRLSHFFNKNKDNETKKED